MPILKSESIANLAIALIAAQDEFPAVKKESVNPFFGSRYADLSAIIEATQPTLGKHGLVVTQLPGSDVNGQPAVTTLLIHKSGEYIGETLTMPTVKLDPQGVGSAITYARRYGMQSALGVAAEDDDDANAAAAKPAPQKTTAKPAQPAQKATVTESGNQISFKLAEWNEMDGQYGPILVLKWWGKQGLEEKRLFKNTKNAAYFEHLKDLVGNTLTFSTEKKGNYTNLKDLVAVDGAPYVKPNGTLPPVAPKDTTHITNDDIAF